MVAAICIAVAMVVGAGSSAAAPTAVAHLARDCTPPKYPSVGYFNRITVTGAGCATASKVAFAYFHCRTRSGNLAGRCAGGVLGFRCHEVRNAITTFIVGRVTCRRGKARVVHVYEQFLTR